MRTLTKPSLPSIKPRPLIWSLFKKSVIQKAMFALGQMVYSACNNACKRSMALFPCSIIAKAHGFHYFVQRRPVVVHVNSVRRSKHVKLGTVAVLQLSRSFNRHRQCTRRRHRCASHSIAAASCRDPRHVNAEKVRPGCVSSNSHARFTYQSHYPVHLRAKSVFSTRYVCSRVRLSL